MKLSACVIPICLLRGMKTCFILFCLPCGSALMLSSLFAWHLPFLTDTGIIHIYTQQSFSLRHIAQASRQPSPRWPQSYLRPFHHLLFIHKTKSLTTSTPQPHYSPQQPHSTHLHHGTRIIPRARRRASTPSPSSRRRQTRTRTRTRLHRRTRRQIPTQARPSHRARSICHHHGARLRGRDRRPATRSTADIELIAWNAEPSSRVKFTP